MKVTLQMDRTKFNNKVNATRKRAQDLITTEIHKDSDYYAKDLTGALRKSGVIEVGGEISHIIWDTPYARRQYATIQAASTHKNPHAQWRWFEKAKEEHLDDWTEGVKRVYRNDFRGFSR